jgi:hypothetical protein
MMANVKNLCEGGFLAGNHPDDIGMMAPMEPAASAADWGK